MITNRSKCVSKKESTHGCQLCLHVCDFTFLLFQEIFFVLELALERRNLTNKKHYGESGIEIYFVGFAHCC